MDLQDFLQFRRMITPLIIKFLFWLGIAGSVIWGLFVAFGGLFSGITDNNFLGVIVSLICAPVIIGISIVAVRIYSELLIVIFQMNETLTDIKKALEEK